MLIAFATDNRKEINEHFGRARRFSIYEVSSTGFRFAQDVDLMTEGDEEDDKISERLNALRDCAIVYSTAIGGVAAARLVKNRIHPIKVEAGHPIEDVLVRLRKRLIDNPPVWLKKAMHKGTKKGFSEGRAIDG